MIYKVGVLGASGRVGQEICAQLAAGFEIGRDYFELSDAVAASKELESIDGVPLRTLKEPDREPVHGWIDFSNPDATLTLLQNIETPLVIGTTGFSAVEKKEIKKYSEKFPVLMSSNMSPGMNWLFSMLKTLPPPLGITEISVLDEHHRHKKDAPSGTAKTLVQVLEGQSEVPISTHAIRAGEAIGFHEVVFYGDAEEIRISHRATDRKIFARGALLGLHFLFQKKSAGLYSMEDLYDVSRR